MMKLWTEPQVRGKLDIYCSQMERPSINGRHDTLRELAETLITEYVSIYPDIAGYRTRLGIS